MQKILLSVLAAIALVGSVAPTSAAPAAQNAGINQISPRLRTGDDVEVNHMQYSIYRFWNNEFCESYDDTWVAVFEGCTDEFYMPSNLVIPDEITVEGEKIPVVAFQNYLIKNGLDKVTSLTLGKNIQIVSGFSSMSNLKTLNLNEGLRVIKEFAFMNASVSSVVIPSTVRMIGKSAFSSCPLEKLTFENGSADDEFGLTICDAAFYGCSPVSSINLPVQTVKVDPQAFRRNGDLKEITVSDGCKNLRSDAGVLYQKSGDSYDAIYYPGAREGESYSFPEFMNGGHIVKYFLSRNSVGNNYGQSIQLKNLDFSKLTAPIVIDEHGIDDMYDITEINLLNVDSIMADGVVVGAKEVKIGKETRYVNPLAFSGGTVTYVVDPANEYYKNGTDGALLKIVADGLELARVPNAWNITNYTVADDVVALGDQSFWFCNNITEVTWPNGLKRVGADAFDGDHKLTKINYTGDQLDYVAASALYGFNNFGWWSMQPEGGVYFRHVLYRWKGEVDENTVVRVKEGTRVLSPYSLSAYVTPSSYATSETKNMKSVSLPASLEKIYEYAFYHNKNLTSVNIPSGVTFIGDHAFCQTGLEKVVIPDNVTEIGAAAFNATPATEVTIGSYASDKAQTTIGEYAFSSMPNVTKLLLGGNVTQIGDLAFMSVANQAEKSISVEIPSSVTSIGYGAFTGSNIDKLRIGAGVKSVGKGAFCCFEEGIYDDEWQQIGTNCSLKEIHIEALTPPAVYMKYETDDISLFTEAVYAKLPLFVPVGKVADYRAAEGWNMFARILNEGDEDSIESISADSRASIAAGTGCIAVDAPADMPVVVASLSGTLLYSGHGSATIAVAPGIYIVRAGSDTVKLTVR